MTELEIRRKLESRISKTGECWIYGNGKRYGSIIIDGKNKRAHRVYYELTVGPIPEGLQLDHLCRNIACVRPDHLEPVTNQENTRRGLSGVLRNPENVCKRGHLLSPDNCYYWQQSSGLQRKCRTCELARAKKRFALSQSLQKEQND